MTAFGAFLIAVLYLLGLLAFVAVVDRRPAWRDQATRPLFFALALGVYASAWSLFGSVGFVHRTGFGFLAIHVGAALSCFAIPLLWAPLSRVIRRYRLAHVADFLSFRFQSQLVGTVVTMVLVFAVLPYIALQLRAITDAAQELTRAPASGQFVSFAYAFLLGTFATVLGLRFSSPRDSRKTLLLLLALESVVKLVALLVVAVAAYRVAFGGELDLAAWLERQPGELERMYRPLTAPPFAAWVGVSFVAMFLLPRQFHVAFVERPNDEAWRAARWMTPLYLLVINLPVPLLYWAGRRLVGDAAPPDLYVVAVASEIGLGPVAFVAGVAAGCGMVLVSTHALASMVMLHVVVPIRRWMQLAASEPRLLQLRRIVIFAVVFAGFALHLILPRQRSLVDIGLMSFGAVLQLAPGTIGGWLWPRASRGGFLAGLAGGVFAWLLLEALPQLGYLEPLTPSLGQLGWTPSDLRSASTWISIVVNGALFVGVSLIVSPGREEEAAATALGEGRTAEVRTPATVGELVSRVTPILGESGAEEEVHRALESLALDAEERRPLYLRELTREVERGLSELVGPLTARILLGAGSPSHETSRAIVEELKVLERQRPGPSGVDVRQYLGGVLNDLPVGVCTLDEAGELVVWNDAIATMTNLAREQVQGARIDDLPPPWPTIFASALALSAGQVVERAAPGERILRLQVQTFMPRVKAQMVVVEDLTERRSLRAQATHQDRLASIGRLAAAVAHEVRNPLTGVLMVAHSLRREHEGQELGERLDLIHREASRIEEIVKTLLSFGRSGETSAPLHREDVAVRTMIDDAVSLVSLGRRQQTLQWCLEIEAGHTVHADRNRIIQVLVNLLANAADASPDGGTIRISSESDGDELLRITVADQGPGVAEEVRGRLFEPFFTTKEAGEGTGLGLAVARRIARDHGGDLHWVDAEGGARFALSLPTRADRLIGGGRHGGRFPRFLPRRLNAPDQGRHR
ncbi:MAG: ATP-binding protein, partial [Myxococcota bacterium]